MELASSATSRHYKIGNISIISRFLESNGLEDGSFAFIRFCCSARFAIFFALTLS
jgi:hypothetical protein